MFLDRLDSVRRTGWIITARCRKQWRNPELVSTNYQNESASHCSCISSMSSCVIFSTSLSSTSKGASYAISRLLTTTSTAFNRGMILVRASSFRRLLRRFLSTIVCPCFATITVTLACESRESAARTSRCSVRIRLPAFFTSSRSELRVSRRLRGYPYLLGAGVLAWQPDRQLLPSFLPATAQNLATPPG